MAWYGMVRYGWDGMVWCGMGWYGLGRDGRGRDGLGRDGSDSTASSVRRAVGRGWWSHALGEWQIRGDVVGELGVAQRLERRAVLVDWPVGGAVELTDHRDPFLLPTGGWLGADEVLEREQLPNEGGGASEDRTRGASEEGGAEREREQLLPRGTSVRIGYSGEGIG
jgi:hypothetical protein